MGGKSWEHVVRDCVEAHYHVERELSMRSKERLNLYLHCNEDPTFKQYLHGTLTQGTKLLFRFRSGNVALNGALAFSDEQHDLSCPCCGAHDESVLHALLECPQYAPARMCLLHEVQNVVGPDVMVQFQARSSFDQCVALLGMKFWGDKAGQVCEAVQRFLCKSW